MLKLIKNLTKKDILIILLTVILIAISVFLDLKVPEYMSDITRIIETNSSNIISILKIGGMMMLATIGSLVCSVLVGYLISLLASGFSYNIRSKIFNKVMSFSKSEIKRFKTSSLITRTTNDVTQIEIFLSMGLMLLIKAPIMASWAISKIVVKNMEWSILTGVCVVILLITVITISLIVFPRFERIQKLIDKVNGHIEENLTGIRVVRAFNAEKYTYDKFQKVNDELTHNLMFNQKTFAFLNPIMNFVMHGLTIGIYFIGAILINNAMMSDKITLFSNMVVFSSYGMQIIASFLILSMIFMILPRANVSAKRINEVLECDLSIKDANTSLPLNSKGTVSFKNVSFKYPDADDYLLKDISFDINAGETVAIIGGTGSGKSTLINLIPRFYDVTDGEILVDGVNVKDIKENHLRKIIGYVSQKAIMFSGTVKSNVTLGSKKVDEIVLDKSLNIAQADFVKKLEKGNNSHIAFGGTNISGGQKQRLSIARAIYHNPEIYIFDDTFSALDYKTDYKLRTALKEYTRGATNIIVAQRIGTIMNADKIIVLDNGKCVGIGKHKELLKKCKVYKEIAYSQLSKEELENA